MLELEWAETGGPAVTAPRAILADVGSFLASAWSLGSVGTVEPKQEPRLLTPITKKRSVSTGLPGPTMLSHQPSERAWPW